MSADYQHLGLGADANLIKAFWVKSPVFGFHWHYHPELEITCVKQGRGNRLVADNVSPFAAGDFVFMGSNVPHTWVSDDEFNSAGQAMEVAVLQFHPSVFAPSFLQLPELKNIQNLLELANRGIVLNARYQAKAAAILYDLIAAEGIQRLTLFMQLLDFIGAADDSELLASPAYTPLLNNVVEERIIKVCRYAHENFRRAIKLSDVAQLASMNPTSFCRFFRKSTGQSFFSYINDLRIGKAANLLLDKRNLSIAEIAFQSGFNSQTLFNRSFFKKKQMTPTEFRKRLRY